MHTLFYLCPDMDAPSGGVKVIYRHVDLLNKNGFRASVLHRRKGFRCSWFRNKTRISYTTDSPLRRGDWLAVPEILAEETRSQWPRAPRVIFAQNAYLLFARSAIGRKGRGSAFLAPEVKALLVVSEDSRRYARRAFPQTEILRLRLGIDPSLFGCSGRKKRQIAFMPRRLLEDAVQVAEILRLRGALKGFRLVPIQNKSERETARILGESLLFFSFSSQEGLPLPPLEAMARGCVVVGYPGRGGNEYFRPEFCYPVAEGDVAGFARTAEQVLRRCAKDGASMERKGRAASRHILRKYSEINEERSVVQAWRKLLPAGWQGKPSCAADPT